MSQAPEASPAPTLKGFDTERLNAYAADLNGEIEFKRNMERYSFLRWGQKAFDNFRVVPPAIFGRRRSITSATWCGPP